MLGHFSGLYKYAQNCSAIDAPFLHIIPYSLLTEGFWLRLFYVLSGYLVSRSRVCTVRDLMRKMIMRFARLALPLLGASFFILLITALFGIHNKYIQAVVANQWVATSYSEPLTFAGAITEPFRVLLLGESVFSPVWWVLKSMFFASLLVYLITYAGNLRFSNQASSPIASVAASLVFILFFIYSGKDIYFSVLIGALYGYCEQAVCKAIEHRKWICWLMLVAPVVGFQDPNCISKPGVLFFTDASFVCFIIAVEHLKLPNALFTKLDKLGSISFGIYSLHWPVFCSIGLLIIIKGITKMQGFLIYLISITVCVLITIGLSILFWASVEKWSSVACKKLDHLLAVNREAAP